MMYSTSTGGSLTGEGGDVIIVDDPQNPLMANSETERQASINFFRSTLQTRLNDPKKGAIIIIMQRLHENDLTGYILTEKLGYTHLCLPAEAEQRTIIRFPVSGKEIIRLGIGETSDGERRRRDFGGLDAAGCIESDPE